MSEVQPVQTPVVTSPAPVVTPVVDRVSDIPDVAAVLTDEDLSGSVGDVPKTPAPKPDKDIPAVKDGEKKAAVVPPAKAPKVTTPYTAEEIVEVLEGDGDIDASRLSPEGKLLMKSFSKGFDKKFQALAAEKKQLQATQVATPKVKLFQQYISNPLGVTADINREIETLEAIGVDHPEYEKARGMVRQLHALKEEFRLTKEHVATQIQGRSEIATKAMREILEEIPDWTEKEPKMTEFAQGLGLEIADIQYLSDPTIHGARSVRIIKAINKLYDKIDAGRKAEEKRKAPAPLGRAGETDDSSESKEKPIEEMSMSEYRKYRQGKQK